MRKNVSLFLLGGVTIALLVIGSWLVLDAHNTAKWATNPPLDPSVFGAGVSVTAVGLAFLFALTAGRKKE